MGVGVSVCRCDAVRGFGAAARAGWAKNRQSSRSHLHADERRERNGGGGRFALPRPGSKCVARGAETGHGARLPGGALAPSRQLLQGNTTLVVLPHEGADGCGADVAASDDVPEQGEGRDQRVRPAAGGTAHVCRVGRVEAEGGGGGAVGHQVDPQEVQGAEHLGEAQEGGEEDGGHLADVAAGRGGGEGGDEARGGEGGEVCG